MYKSVEIYLDEKLTFYYIIFSQKCPNQSKECMSLETPNPDYGNKLKRCSSFIRLENLVYQNNLLKI